MPTSRPDEQTNDPQLVYLVFGAHTYHQEAQFSIASALARLRETPNAKLHIQVFSDDPAPYQALPVTVHLLTPDTRRTWSGPYGYHFRSKHVALREVLSRAGKALLIDTDTFFHASPAQLFERIQPGRVLCNAVQQRYDTDPAFPLYANLASTLQARQLAPNDMALVNSGVIGMTHHDACILDESIALMDEFYPKAEGVFTLEEFCLAVAAQSRGEVQGCTDLIHHYWSRKALFRAKVRAWLSKHANAPTSQSALDDTLQVNAKLPRPPTWQRLLHKLGTLGIAQPERQFVRELLNGCYRPPNEFDQACSPVWWEKAAQNFAERRQSPLDARELEGLLGRPLVRFAIGKHRQAIYHQLSAGNPE